MGGEKKKTKGYAKILFSLIKLQKLTTLKFTYWLKMDSKMENKDKKPSANREETKIEDKKFTANSIVEENTKKKRHYKHDKRWSKKKKGYAFYCLGSLLICFLSFGNV